MKSHEQAETRNLTRKMRQKPWENITLGQFFNIDHNFRSEIRSVRII